LRWKERLPVDVSAREHKQRIYSGKRQHFPQSIRTINTITTWICS